MPYSLSSHLKYLGNLVQRKNFWVVFFVDILLIILAHLGAYLLRFPGWFYGPTFDQFATALPGLIVVKLTVFYGFGLYRGMWRYTSLHDLVNVIKASVASFLIIVTIILFLHRFEGFSRSVFVIDGILTFLLIGGHRLVIRFSYEHFFSSGPAESAPRNFKRRRLLLVGAGDAAEQIIREVQGNPALPYHVVGLVDDNPAKIGFKIHNIPVLGLIDDLKVHCRRAEVEEILIAISSLTGEQVKRLNRLCRATGIKYKVLPGLGELIDGRTSIKMMRDISYKDLLGRAEVQLDQDEIGEFLTAKVILVTGAGGSIGSELCRQIVRFKPAKIVLLDAGEENLYNIQMELVHEFNCANCCPVLGRIQDFKLIEKTIAAHRPTIIFHAAAYKHVPLVENNPWEAVFNNVIGTRCLIEAAIIHKVKRFVLVSTDKAVRPTNVMGASKRLTEMMMQACTREKWDGTLAHGEWEGGSGSGGNEGGGDGEARGKTHETIFQAVRFGNVLGSSGSVIPLFKRQIEIGGPLTITDPKITRYFMSVVEAARLIIQAGAMGRGGEIFILKMGEPVKIDKMARDLIRLAGREPDTEIAIKYIGLRPGEKLYEELITEGEGIVPTPHEKIMVLRGNGKTYTEINTQITLLQQQADKFNESEIKKTLKKIIPEYTPE